MAYYDSINLVKGDDLPALEIIIRDSNAAASGQTLDIGDVSTWAPVDLSDVNTVKMKFRKIGSSTLVATITFTRVAPYIDGKVTMDWGSTTLDDGHGDYEGEIEITYDNGKVLTVPDLFKFIIRDQF
tara:strand:+ start:1791 stop:2171 length:381 start_codon:yes stop_codon:yes gene_type:complete